MSIEDEIINGSIFREEGVQQQPENSTPKEKTTKARPRARTMAEATAGLKSLNSKSKKSKAGTFVKGTHGSGAAKMRADYKRRKQSRTSKKK